MYTFNTIASLVLFAVTWQFVGATTLTCDPTWNSVPLGTNGGRTSCQVENQYYGCYAEDCWTGTQPPKGTKNTLRIVFTDCYRYTNEFGNSKQEKTSVKVWAMAYYMIRKKGHVNVMGFEEGKADPNLMAGFRCHDVNTPLAQCPSDSCSLTNVH
ncbi:uncharacterized protein MELLADRAFT_124198 [Melampsora larici-populina 98AG31]|uniref:Secreted protein n=1 Tax=Melampsora larici-populina (strain 98AG31 / pathotype 3-4-7) TaxID=747676 RepID=F4S5Y6_MELLP|nr:uncharacterized protein MELLADRAFT_124198 [Melampsora larici-populina 98AG31]EGF99986.1 secreted protein [Melampsora larici-populina 98AG31]